MEDHEDLVDYDLDLDANKDEFSDLVCETEEVEVGGGVLECAYCDQVLQSHLELRPHLIDKHCVNKNLDFLYQVTLDKQRRDVVGAECISPEPLGQEENKVVVLEDVSDIESEDEDRTPEPQIRVKAEASLLKKLRTEDETVEVKVEAATEEENSPVTPPEVVVKEEVEEEKRDWKYEAAKAVSDISEDEEVGQKRTEAADVCKKCDKEHPVGERCHFLLRSSEKDRARKDRAHNKPKREARDVRGRVGRRRVAPPPLPSSSRRSALSPSRLVATKHRGVRIAPPDPRIEAASSGSRKVRTLPSDLYNNPDALTARSRSPEECSWRKEEDLYYASRRTGGGGGDSRRRSRSRSPHHRRSRRSPEESDRTNRCQLCKSSSHVIEDCDQMFCHICNAQGHFSKYCLERKAKERDISISSFPVLPPVVNKQNTWDSEVPSYPSAHSLGAATYTGGAAAYPSYSAGATGYPPSHSAGAPSYPPSHSAGAPSYPSINKSDAGDYLSYSGGLAGYPLENGGVSGLATPALLSATPSHTPSASSYSAPAYKYPSSYSAGDPRYTNSAAYSADSEVLKASHSYPGSTSNFPSQQFNYGPGSSEGTPEEYAPLQTYIARKISQLDGNSVSYSVKVGENAVKLLKHNNLTLGFLKSSIEKTGTDYVATQTRSLFSRTAYLVDSKGSGELYSGVVVSLITNFLSGDY